MRGWTVMWLCAVAFAAAGCGGSDTPTEVSAADLDRDGEFWNSLTPDLKDELVDEGKDKLGEERPDGATTIKAYDTGELVEEVDKQYSNESKRETSIYETYRLANDRKAREGFDSAIDQLEQLRNEEP